MKTISKITMLAGILTLASYCSGKSNIQVAVPGSEIKAPADATSVAARVLADSGATLSIGNSVQLTVPAGALNADTDISIEKKGISPQQDNLVPVAASLDFGAHGTEFNKPVALNVCYDASKLAAQGIKEETVAVYYVDPATGEYASIGGAVNKASHCVTADLQHFSTYLVAAQILQGGNNAPVISAPTLLPTTPMAGLPLRFSTVITDFEQNVVNGQVGFGQIATARLFYRIYQGDVNAAAYTEVALTPDYNDATATRFTAKIPASAVTTAGLEYYIRATDNLGLPKLRYPVKLPNQPSIAINSTATSLSFQTNVVTDLAAGFKRAYTVKGNNNLGGSYNVEVESFAVNNGIGTATQLSSAVVQFAATTAGAQSSRTGSLTVTSGAFSLTSLDIRVHAGVLDHIALLSPTGVVLGNTITVNANSTYDFDVLGYDAFGNTSNVLPLFVLVPVTGAGTISPTGLYAAPATVQTATLVATLDGVQDSILINVVVPVPSQWITGSNPLTTGRYVHTATKLSDGRILIAGGKNSNDVLSSVEIYDAAGNAGAGSTYTTASMSAPRWEHQATLMMDGRVLITGGANFNGGVNFAEIFDPYADNGVGAFSAPIPMGTMRWGHTATLLNDGRVLVAGGGGLSGVLNSAELFDPAGNNGYGSFSALSGMSFPRYHATAVKLQSGKVLIAAGFDAAAAGNTAEIFDPSGNAGLGSFSQTGSLAGARYMHTATLLPSGKILVAGGMSNNVSLSSSEIFDPSQNSGVGGFATTGAMNSPRYFHSATGLNDGRVLMVGGIDNNGSFSAEIFDPNSNAGLGAFTHTISPQTPRAGHTGTLTNDGRVAVIGGMSGISSIETFQP